MPERGLPPSSRSSAWASTVLPAPVSPVMAVRPSPGRSSARSIRSRFSMRSSSSTVQVYQQHGTDSGSVGACQMPIKTNGWVAPACAMTDPRIQDLSELPRHMTATLDLPALSRDLTSRAIEATGAAIGAIALWDREHDCLVTLADLEAVKVGSAIATGETYARLDEYPASRRALTDR